MTFTAQAKQRLNWANTWVGKEIWTCSKLDLTPIDKKLNVLYNSANTLFKISTFAISVLHCSSIWNIQMHLAYINEGSHGSSTWHCYDSPSIIITRNKDSDHVTNVTNFWSSSMSQTFEQYDGSKRIIHEILESRCWAALQHHNENIY